MKQMRASLYDPQSRRRTYFTPVPLQSVPTLITEMLLKSKALTIVCHVSNSI